MTIITGALRRAGDIALAAKARAFSPVSTRAWPIKPLDKWVVAAAVVGLVLLVLV